MTSSTRDQHLARCKERALETLDQQHDIRRALSEFLSDLRKHKETRVFGSELSLIGLIYMAHQDEANARKFIEGFN